MRPPCRVEAICPFILLSEFQRPLDMAALLFLGCMEVLLALITATRGGRDCHTRDPI